MAAGSEIKSYCWLLVTLRQGNGYAMQSWHVKQYCTCRIYTYTGSFSNTIMNNICLYNIYVGM